MKSENRIAAEREKLKELQGRLQTEKDLQILELVRSAGFGFADLKELFETGSPNVAETAYAQNTGITESEGDID